MPSPPRAAARAAPLAELEAFAWELAREAGARIAAACGAPLRVAYKDHPKGRAPTAAVSDVDRDIEALLRKRIAAHHPEHGVIGEEVDAPAPGREWLWVLDPLDGTANFVNRYPLFACSIGLLRRGEPVVGAVWCAATSALRPGTWHARRGGALHFDGEPYRAVAHAGVQRGLAGLPPRDAGRGRVVDHRVTGSAASECAYVAAGLLRFSLLRRISIWDVAAGLVLARAAGRTLRELVDESWRPFERFAPPPAPKTLRDWRGTLLLGEPDEEEPTAG